MALGVGVRASPFHLQVSIEVQIKIELPLLLNFLDVRCEAVLVRLEVGGRGGGEFVGSREGRGRFLRLLQLILGLPLLLLCKAYLVLQVGDVVVLQVFVESVKHRVDFLGAPTLREGCFVFCGRPGARNLALVAVREGLGERECALTLIRLNHLPVEVWVLRDDAEDVGFLDVGLDFLEGPTADLMRPVSHELVVLGAKQEERICDAFERLYLLCEVVLVPRGQLALVSPLPDSLAGVSLALGAFFGGFARAVFLAHT